MILLLKETPFLPFSKQPLTLLENCMVWLFTFVSTHALLTSSRPSVHCMDFSKWIVLSSWGVSPDRWIYLFCETSSVYVMHFVARAAIHPAWNIHFHGNWSDENGNSSDENFPNVIYLVQYKYEHDIPAWDPKIQVCPTYLLSCRAALSCIAAVLDHVTKESNYILRAP